MWLIRRPIIMFIHQPIHVITWSCTILAHAWDSYKWKYVRHGIIVLYWCRRLRLTWWLACQVIVCRPGQWLTFSGHCWNHIIVRRLTRWLTFAGHSWNETMCRSAALSLCCFKNIGVFVCTAPLIFSYISLSSFTIVLISYRSHLFIIMNNILLIYGSLNTQERVPFHYSGSVQFTLLIWLCFYFESGINSYLLFIYPPYYLCRHASLAWYSPFVDDESVLLDYWDITTFSRGTPSCQQ